MARFRPINDVVEDALLGNKDYLMRAKGRYLRWAKDVYLDMNMGALKKCKRERFQINKRTNTIKMPCDFQYLSSVNIMDHKGVEWPVYRNYRLHIDIVDVGSAKNCSCEYQCGFQLCNTIKGYEAITSTKSDILPNGTPVSFTCVDRKSVDRNGFLYIETQYPQRIYTDGVWTNTILYTNQEKLCQCEVNENGCLCDSEQNIDNVCNAFGGVDLLPGIPFGGSAQGPPNSQENTWIYHCNSKQDWLNVQCGGMPRFKHHCNNIYNISELGDTLIFPHHFGFDSVIVRYYYDVTLKNMEIPLIAVPAFIMGLKYWDYQFDDTKIKEAQWYGQKYADYKFGLLKEMNKYRIAEVAEILVPKTRVPSYIDHRRDRERDEYLY
jgi:hypothetical protein